MLDIVSLYTRVSNDDVLEKVSVRHFVFLIETIEIQENTAIMIKQTA